MRYFGTYYRVKFFGEKVFGKELTKQVSSSLNPSSCLPDFSARSILSASDISELCNDSPDYEFYHLSAAQPLLLQEFVYKEPALTKLPEICGRLRQTYGDEYGAGRIEMIQDSKEIDPEALKKDQGYIQVRRLPGFHPHSPRLSFPCCCPCLQ